MDIAVKHTLILWIRQQVLGARAAGIAPVLLDRHELYPDLSGPRLRSLEQLPALLEGRGGPDQKVQA